MNSQSKLQATFASDPKTINGNLLDSILPTTTPILSIKLMAPVLAPQLGKGKLNGSRIKCKIFLDQPFYWPTISFSQFMNDLAVNLLLIDIFPVSTLCYQLNCLSISPIYLLGTGDTSTLLCYSMKESVEVKNADYWGIAPSMFFSSKTLTNENQDFQ